MSTAMNTPMAQVARANWRRPLCRADSTDEQAGHTMARDRSAVVTADYSSDGMSVLWLLVMVVCMFATDARAQSTPVPKNGPGVTVFRTAATVLGHAFGSSQHPALPSELLIKFTGPFRIGPVSLPAGTYRFRNAGPSGANVVLVVMSHDVTRTYALVHTLPARRDTLDGVSIVFDRQRPDAPPRIKALFWPGLMGGLEVQYETGTSAPLSTQIPEPDSPK